MNVKEKPIMFTSEMVNAILEGRKSQTRRVVRWRSNRADEVHDDETQGNVLLPMKDGSWWPYYVYDGNEIPLKCPYQADTLWVREWWRIHKDYDSFNAKICYLAMAGDVIGCVDYKAAPRDEDFWGRWRSSMFMPRWASRINLKVNKIRVEKVNDISEKDALAESCVSDAVVVKVHGVKDYTGLYACDRFSGLWDSINKKRGYGWYDNPWVWVVEFERID